MGQAFRDQVVVVTGGARGIGDAIIRAFLEQGASAVSIDLGESVVGWTGPNPPAVRLRTTPFELFRLLEPRSHLPEEPQNRCRGPGYLTPRQGTRIMLRLIAQSLPPRVLPNLRPFLDLVRCTCIITLLRHSRMALMTGR